MAKVEDPKLPQRVSCCELLFKTEQLFPATFTAVVNCGSQPGVTPCCLLGCRN